MYVADTPHAQPHTRGSGRGHSHLRRHPALVELRHVLGGNLEPVTVADGRDSLADLGLVEEGLPVRPPW